jgi:DNA-binding transcriptional MerR regulator
MLVLYDRQEVSGMLGGKVPLPEPRVEIDGTPYYTLGQVVARRPDGRIRQDLALEVGYYTCSQAARYCGMPDSTWRYHVSIGDIPPPTHSLGGYRKHYTRAEVEELRQSLADMAAEPLYSIRQAAAACGLSLVEFHRLVRHGKIPQPTRRGRRLCYTQEEMDQITARLEEVRAAV